MKEKLINENIKILEWDTNLFGYKVALLDTQIAKNFELDFLKQKLTKNNVKLLYIFKNPVETNIEGQLEKLGATKVDEKITYHKYINNEPEEYFISEIVPFNSRLVNDHLLSLALQSGLYSRFNTDSHFKNNEYFKLYSKWIERSVRKEIADEVLVFADSGGEYGMITLKINKNTGTIGLFAVDKDMRGKSVGKKLVKASEKLFLNKKVDEIFVATQNENVSACKFYESNGFTVHNKKIVYHLWL